MAYHFSRAKALWGQLCLITLICALNVPANASDTRIRLADMAQSLNGIASQVMIDQEIDHKYGLDVTYRAYPTLDGLFNAIRGRQVDIGFGGWTGFAQFRIEGYPVVNIFPVGRGSTLDVLVPADSELKSLEDLKGKRVASYAGAAGTATVLLRVVLNDFYGFDPGTSGDLQYVGPGIIPNLLKNGDIDAGMLFDPLATKAIASGEFRSIGNLGDVYKARTGEDFLWISLATNDQFAEANPEALANFLKAWVESVEYVKNNPAVFDAYGKQLGLDEEGIALLAERVIHDYTTVWNDEYIDALRSFADRALRVMRRGYLRDMPEDAFTTRFSP